MVAFDDTRDTQVGKKFAVWARPRASACAHSFFGWLDGWSVGWMTSKGNETVWRDVLIAEFLISKNPLALLLAQLESAAVHRDDEWRKFPHKCSSCIQICCCCLLFSNVVKGYVGMGKVDCDPCLGLFSYVRTHRRCNGIFGLSNSIWNLLFVCYFSFFFPLRPDRAT